MPHAASRRQAGSEIRHRQMPELVAERLRERVMRGELRPGDRLPMRTLADEFGVSVIPVRDALRSLASEGLVELQPHRGAIVAQISSADLEEIFLARLPLEQLAGSKALGSFSDADLRLLARLEGQMERASDPKKWLELNRQFHLEMYQRSGYDRLLRIIEGLWDLIAPYLRLFMSDAEAVRNAEREHREMISAIETGNAPLLSALIEEHLSNTAAKVAPLLGDEAAGQQWQRRRRVLHHEGDGE